MNGGNEEAFETLYLRHRDWAFRMACRLTSSAHSADDVMQDAFCYFLGKFPGFALRCQLRTFLYPVIRNLSLNMVKKSRRYDGGAKAETHLNQLADPSGDLQHGGDIFDLTDTLSTDHREILLLRFIDGMSLPEISEMISIPLGTAKSRLHHALAALRDTPAIREISVSSERSTIPNC
jgi:RNA polymerase sigma-70 factor (ECF subfamily)